MPKFWRESQFQIVDGVERFGMCGPNALAMAEAFALQHYVSTATIYDRMAAAQRLDDPSGAATIWQLDDQARADGMQTEFRGFSTAPWPDWRQWFWYQTNAGKVGILETGNGQVLVDLITGLGENARNLQFHFILLCQYHPGGPSTVVNRILPPGFWCADGCSLTSGGGLQFYSLDVLDKADPRAGLAISQLKETIVIPQGYTQNADGSLTAPAFKDQAGNALPIVTLPPVVATEWLKNPVAYGDPIEKTTINPQYDEYLFYDGLMAEDRSKGTPVCVVGGAGQRAYLIAQQLAAVQAQLVALQKAPAAPALPDGAEVQLAAFHNLMDALVAAQKAVAA